MKLKSPWAVVIAAVLFLVAVGADAAEISAPLRPLVVRSLRNDISPRLHTLAPLPPSGTDQARAVPLRRLPKAAAGQNRPSSVPSVDPAVQGATAPNTMPSTLKNFEGIHNLDYVYPPDTNGDVGPNHYIQMVNLSFQIWNKAGESLYGPAATNTLWAGVGGFCENVNDGDPVVLYDHLADRWMMSQFALPNYPHGPYYECIAVSASADPLGSWYRYEFEVHGTKMNDYPHFGIWPDGYYMSVNQFIDGDAWGGGGVYVFDRESMLQGLPASFVYFDLYEANPGFGGMLPAHLNGAVPPAGTPNYFVEMDDSAWLSDPQDMLRVWAFHVDWTAPLANSTFGLSGQPNYLLPVENFDPLCLGVSNCIPQPGTTQKLDAISDRLMYRLQYRMLGSEQRMVVNHTVSAGSGRAGVRWYELSNSGSGWSVAQQGTYAPADTESRWMGSIAMDKDGNMALGYSVASSTVYPSIRYTGRLSGDPAGQMSRGESVMMVGSGSQTGSAARWGDYSSMSVDPVDGCTFWYTQEYMAVTGPVTWQTRIASFKYPTCTNGPTGFLEGTATSATGPVVGATVSATGGFTTTTDGSGFYRFENLPTGGYELSVTKYGYAPSSASNVLVTSGNTTTQNFTLNRLPSAVVQGLVSDGSGQGWPLYARIDITGPGYAHTLYTDAMTGRYSVSLYQGLNYNFQVAAVSAGYSPSLAAVTPAGGSLVRDFALLIDSQTCSAPGYVVTPGDVLLEEFFESGTIPAGWTNKDNIGNGQVWQFDDPNVRGNGTGGSLLFAMVDSDTYGSGSGQDTELILPVIDASAQPMVFLTFNSDYAFWNGFAEVDVSSDGGTVWTNVWSRTADDPGPSLQTINISPFAGGAAALLVRFHYTASQSFWWKVDNVKLQGFSCTASVGGLVSGHIFDLNSGAALNYATVSDGTVSTLTGPTPGDTASPDGYYSLFLPAGSAGLTASRNLYAAELKNVMVITGAVQKQDFHLAAGRLLFVPASLSVALNIGDVLTLPLLIRNTGTAPVNYTLVESAGLPALPTGPFEKPALVVKPFKQGSRTAAGLHLPPLPAGPSAPGDVVNSWSTGLPLSWGISYDSGSGTVWVGSPAADWGGTDTFYEYATSGTPTGRTLPFSWLHSNGPADAAYNWLTHKSWLLDVDGQCIYEVAHPLGATGNSICPDFGVSQRGLAYDPSSNTWFAGGWNDYMIHHFDASGGMLDAVNVGLPVSGLAYNPGTQHLFAMVSADPTLIYVLDAANNYADLGTPLSVPGFSSAYGGAGLELDCNGHLWAVDQFAQKVFEIDTGEVSTACTYGDLPWLSEAPSSGSLGAGATRTVEVTFDASKIAAPGVYQAQLLVDSYVPYGNVTLPVTMTVSAPCQVNKIAPGELAFGAAGGPGSIQVTTGSGCQWNPVVELTWVSVTSLTPTTLSFTVAPNPGPYVRTGTFTIGGQVVTLTQAGSAQRLLEVAVTAANGGTVSGTGMTCNDACFNFYSTGTSLVLTAAAHADHMLTGWSGCDSASADKCFLNLTADKSVAASFSACGNQPVRIMGGLPYMLLTEVYTFVLAGDVVQAQAGGFAGDLLLDRPVAFVLEGGFDCGYTGRSGYTAVNGSLTLTAVSGTLTVDRIILQ